MTEQNPRQKISYRYRFGTAEFDEAWFELRVAGLRVDVEPRALEVLACLLRHAGEVVTKEELLTQVWAGRMTVDQVLPNAIVKLRRALGEANAGLVATQARVGYRLTGAVERIAIGRRLESQLQLAPGQNVPARDNFILQRQLGGNGGSEVWLAEHAKTHERRVYKFASDDDRLRALKREATLSRLLEEALDDRAHFVDLIDWNFENPPFFLECAYGGENLLEWSKKELANTVREQRLGLFLQIADAVAAAHGVGVLHKDLKPANVLIAPGAQGPLIRLTDFGSGRLLDPGRLDELGITGLGFTVTQSLTADSSAGTPLYIAPEIIAGHAPTVQSDVYALGILLYQILAGDLARPMASGWEQDVDDKLLCDDIRLATDGNPQRRLSSATELAMRLRGLEDRHEQTKRMAAAEVQVRQAQHALARSRAQRPYLIALLLVLAAGAAISWWLYRTTLQTRNEAQQARDQAQHELERANAINRFLNEDVIGSANPYIVANGKKASLKDALLGARDRIGSRFAEQPLTEAVIHSSLAKVFNSLELLPEAEQEEYRALGIYQNQAQASDIRVLRTRTTLISILCRESKLDQAAQELKQLQQAAAGSADVNARYLVSSARANYHFNHGDYAQAATIYPEALALLKQLGTSEEAGNETVMRLNLIAAYTQIRRIADAKREGRDLIAALESRTDKNEWLIAFAKHYLGRALTIDGDYGGAETLLHDAQATVVRLMGEDSIQNIEILGDLRDLAVMRKQWQESFDCAKRLYEVASAKLGADHYATNFALGYRGEGHFELGEMRAAREDLQAALPKLEKALSLSNPEVFEIGAYLCASEISLGEVKNASDLLKRLEAVAKDVDEAAGPQKYKVGMLQGLLLQSQGQADKAAPLLQAALQDLEKNSGSDEALYKQTKEALSVGTGKALAPPKADAAALNGANR